MNVSIQKVNVPYEYTLPSGKKLFQIEEVQLTHEQFTGEMGPTVTRVNFERGDGVGVLPYFDETDEVVLIEQFRYPVYAGRAEPAENKGWLLEIVAGIQDDEPEIVAERELMEETGLELSRPLERLAEFYLSPGGSSESMTLFLAHAVPKEDLDMFAGLEHEGENIRVHVLELESALKLVEIGHIQDAKTILALMMVKARRG